MTTVAERSALPAEVELSVDEEERLLALARLAVAAAARGEADLARDAAAERIGGRPARQRPCGAAFVTLLEDGQLRGCIGMLDPSRPLAESVAGAAIGAVLHDWRFRPVTEDELPAIQIEVSVLGPLVDLEEPTAFRVGLDGLLVERGSDRGLLLPEVAVEHGFDVPAMLGATCGKAGLPFDAWRDRRTRVRAFRTRRFGGPALP
jgi:AmmeMemoRadiSam system protein A